MKALFVVWQDPDSRQWIPVARLTREGSIYSFAYTDGAQKAERFPGFGRMADRRVRYESRQLFPLFANRILPKSRPEYRDYLEWLGLGGGDADVLEVLARSGGLRATDSLEIIPCPEPTADGHYEIYFFSHGLRYLAEKDQMRILDLEHGEPLFLMRDFQNHHDSMALLMRTRDPISIAGYCPRYYAEEFANVIERVGQELVRVIVERVNSEAPRQYRLLCKLTAPWPSGFSPCDADDFRVSVAKAVVHQ